MDRLHRFPDPETKMNKIPKFQTILEEETCGSAEIHGWCDQKPGRIGILTARSENRTALAHFLCDLGEKRGFCRKIRQDF